MLFTVWSGSKAISTLNMNLRRLKKESHPPPGQQAETFVLRIYVHAIHALVFGVLETNTFNRINLLLTFPRPALVYCMISLSILPPANASASVCTVHYLICSCGILMAI